MNSKRFATDVSFTASSRGFFGVCVCIVLCVWLIHPSSLLVGAETGDDNFQAASTSVLVEYELLTPEPITESAIDFYIDLIDNALPFDFSALKDYTCCDVEIYRVTYTTCYQGRQVLASGAVVVPVVGRPLPIASYQRGTIVRNQDAPSQFVSMFLPQVVLNWGIITASSGFICAAPDFLGFGESRDIFHPYHYAFSASRTGIHMLRATKELLDLLNVAYKNEFFLFGFSEGGYTTLAMQREIELFCPDEFPITASAPGGGMYDLYNTVTYYLSLPTMQTSMVPSFILQAYLTLFQPYRDLEEIFRSPYAQRLEEGLLTSASDLLVPEIEAQLSPDPNELFTPDFLADYLGSGEWLLKFLFQMNDLYWGWTPRSTTRFYHGTVDKVVPPFNLDRVEQHFGNKPNLEFRRVEGADHLICYFTWIKETIPWFLSF